MNSDDQNRGNQNMNYSRGAYRVDEQRRQAMEVDVDDENLDEMLELIHRDDDRNE